MLSSSIKIEDLFTRAVSRYHLCARRTEIFSFSARETDVKDTNITPSTQNSSTTNSALNFARTVSMAQMRGRSKRLDHSFKC